MANTMPRSLRVPADLWQSVKVKAEAEGTTLTALVIKWMRAYLRR